MFKLVKIGFTKDKLVLVILKIIANSNQKANLSGNKFRIYEFLINTRIKQSQNSLVGMSPIRDIINLTPQQTPYYIMASSQTQSQKHLLSIISHSSISKTIRNISCNTHEYRIIELKVKEGFQNLFNFTRLIVVENLSKNYYECCQKISQAKEYNFDGISAQSKKAEVFKENLKTEIKKEENYTLVLSNIYQNIKSVQIIRVDQPPGDDISVSYSISMDRWIVSSKKQTGFFCFPIKAQEISQNYCDISKSWQQILLQRVQKMALLKETLRKYTICGKLNSETKQIKWYSVISNSNFESYCEDPLDSKQLLQKCGLIFTKIKTLSVLNSPDKIVRALQNIVSNVRSDVSQNGNKVLGRCTVLLVSSFEKKVLNFFHVLTIEDVILNFMNELFKSTSSKQQKQKLFKSYLNELRQDKKFTFPFPSQHYISMFQKSLQVIELCKLADQIDQKYLQIIKFALYAQLKKIDLQKFGESLPLGKTLLKQIGMFSLQQLSPINCSTVILYNFVFPNCKTKLKTIQSLRLKYQQLSLHFDSVRFEKQQDFSANNLKALIQSSTSNHKVSHIVIDAQASLIQLKILLKQLQSTNTQSCYFRMVVICEKIDTQTIIAGNYFPFSWQSISQFYSEIHTQNLKLGKIQQRCKKLSQVTNYLLGMKNEEISRWQDRIEVNMNVKNGCSKQLRLIIEQIMQLQNMKIQKYYNLIKELQNSSVPVQLNYEETAQSIISRSYTPIKCLDLQTK